MGREILHAWNNVQGTKGNVGLRIDSLASSSKSILQTTTTTNNRYPDQHSSSLPATRDFNTLTNEYYRLAYFFTTMR